MDNDQKKIALGSVMAVVMILLAMFLFSGKRNKRLEHRTKDTYTKTYTQPKNKIKNKRDKATGRQGKARRAHLRKRSPYSDALLEKMNKRKEAAIKKLVIAKKEWLQNKVSDESLSPKTRAKYRFRLIKSYGKAIDAMKGKNYKVALREFRTSLKDPMASPVTKCMAYMYMKSAAQKLGDLDLYIVIAEAEAELIATEDLTALGIEKSKTQKAWVKKFARIMGAAKSSAKFDKLVRKRMNDMFCPSSQRPVISKRVKEQIGEYRTHFKEFFKHDT